MTREEAIEILWQYDVDFEPHPPEEVMHAIDMAIEALSAEALPIHNDGTLEVKVPNAQKVGRVLVMDTDSHIGGGLFYPDDAVDVYKAHEEEHLNIINRIKELQYAIAKTQTIVGKMVESADADVVRCKDCKQRRVEGDCTHYYYCDFLGSLCGDNEYCSFGERREP